MSECHLNTFCFTGELQLRRSLLWDERVRIFLFDLFHNGTKIFLKSYYNSTKYFLKYLQSSRACNIRSKGFTHLPRITNGCCFEFLSQKYFGKISSFGTAKGQIISEHLFDILNLPKKHKKKIWQFSAEQSKNHKIKALYNVFITIETCNHI